MTQPIRSDDSPPAEPAGRQARTDASGDQPVRSETTVTGTGPPLPRENVPALPEPFGRYAILRPLGRGGMGAVYLAHDTQLDRPVALKVPHFGAAEGSPLLERFYREARAAAPRRRVW